MDNSTIKQQICSNLKQARLDKGLTQKKVAELMHKYQPDYCEYETGVIELDYAKIVFLCKLYDITPNDLFEGCF